jgi:hypothetical protein
MIIKGMPSSILGAVEGVSEVDWSGELRESYFVVLTSLAFLIPAFGAWRMKAHWHAYLFGSMVVFCMCYHYCSADPSRAQLDAAGQGKCPEGLTTFFSNAFFAAIQYMILQLAFLLTGPEDPQMQWLNIQSTSGGSSMATPSFTPFDAVITARVLPAVALFVFHFSSSQVEEKIHWQSVLVNELILLVCTVGFWMHPSRRSRAPDVIVRYKFWHRLLHQGFIPAMIFFWTSCLMGLADLQALHSMWHILVAYFAYTLMGNVLVSDSSSHCKVFDRSCNNPNIGHVLLGSVALIVLPTAGFGASFDWCPTGSNNGWPSISKAMYCQPGGYFVAIISVPASAAMAMVFFLIASTSFGEKSGWTHSHEGETEMTRYGRNSVSEETHPSFATPVSGKGLGCLMGQVGSFLGFVSVLIMKGSPLRNLVSLFFSILSAGLIMIAMTLTSLSPDGARNNHFRQRFTMMFCIPIMSVHMMLTLVNQFCTGENAMSSAICAFTENVVLLFVVLWPLTWFTEVQDTWRHLASSKFHWPKTDIRFV